MASKMKVLLPIGITNELVKLIILPTVLDFPIGLFLQVFHRECLDISFAFPALYIIRSPWFPWIHLLNSTLIKFTLLILLVSILYFRFNCTNIPIIIYCLRFDNAISVTATPTLAVRRCFRFTYHNIIQQAGCEHHSCSAFFSCGPMNKGKTDIFVMHCQFLDLKEISLTSCHPSKLTNKKKHRPQEAGEQKVWYFYYCVHKIADYIWMVSWRGLGGGGVSYGGIN